MQRDFKPLTAILFSLPSAIMLMKRFFITNVLMILCAAAFAQEPPPSAHAPATPPIDRHPYVVVGGSVLQPRRVKWTAGMTLLPAISAAGGVSKYATQVELVRNAKSTRFTIKDLQDKKVTDPEVQPGDQIVVH
jgi:hypothetical protein